MVLTREQLEAQPLGPAAGPSRAEDVGVVQDGGLRGLPGPCHARYLLNLILYIDLEQAIKSV